MSGNINRAIGIVVVSGAVALVAWFGLSRWIADAPNRSAVNVLSAVRDRDERALAPYMDSARIEDSLKSEIESAVAWRKEHPEQPGPFQVLFGTMLQLMILPEVLIAPTSPNGATDAVDTANGAKALLTPSPLDTAIDLPAVAHALAQPAAFVKFVPKAMEYAHAELPGPGGDLHDFVTRRIDAPDDNTRIVTLSPDGLDYFVRPQETKLLFERRGLTGWVIVAVDLPDDGGLLFQSADAAPPATPQQ